MQFHRRWRTDVRPLARATGRVARRGGRGAAFGFGTDDLRLLEADELAAHCRPAGVEAATFTPHCAALHPLNLANAIAATARRLGVRIVEGLEVVDVAPRAVTTTAGSVRADHVVLATEAYTTQLPGRRRDVLPMYSMIVGPSR